MRDTISCRAPGAQAELVAFQPRRFQATKKRAATVQEPANTGQLVNARDTDT